MPLDRVVCRRAGREEIHDLRWRILILGTQRDSPVFPGDDHPEAIHVGAFEGSTCIGCASFIPSEWEGTPAWQLRGMATEQSRQRQGVGRGLLEFGEQEARKEHPWPFWCNARVAAVGFYEKQGWQLASEEFLIEAVGPHRKMMKPSPGGEIKRN